MNKKNNLFLIIVPILCIIITGLFFYDRYKTNKIIKEFKQDNQTIETSKPKKEEPKKETLPQIYCVGDSITLGTNKDTNYPTYLKNNLDNPISIIADYSINSQALAIKLGVSNVYVNNLTIPADTKETPINLVDENNQPIDAILTSKTNIDNCTINNIEGSIKYDESNNRLVFKRAKKGNDLSINNLTKVEISKPEITDNSILILFTGSYEESIQGSLTEYQNQIISAFNTDKYIVVSQTKNDRDATNNLLKNTYKEHYLDFKEYLLTNGLKDAGIQETEQDIKDLNNNAIPSSLLEDELNGNSKYNELLAKQLINKMTSLGYIQ